jgi:hypothetical protein
MRHNINRKMLWVLDVIAICFPVVSVRMYAHTEVPQPRSPEQTVQLFCQIDAEGIQVTPLYDNKTGALATGHKSWSSYTELTVIKGYSVRTSGARGEVAQVTVDYEVWGRLDSSLRFMLLAGAFPNRPTSIPESFTLVRLDRHAEPGNDTQSNEVARATEWKISGAPSEPHINVETAIKYVREASYRSRDPIVRMNAQEALADLQRLLSMQALPVPSVGPSQVSPMAVLSQVVALETEGIGLTPDGEQQLQNFFAHPQSWRKDRVHVAKSYAVEDQTFSGKNANVTVQYVSLGELDSSFTLTSSNPGGSTVVEEYKLVFDNKYSLPARGQVPARELVGPSRRSKSRIQSNGSV